MAVTINGSGQVPVQVISTTKTDTFSASVGSGSTAAITGLSATITPTNSSNKVLVMVSVNLVSENVGPAIQLVRGSTAICIGDAAGSRGRVSSGTNQVISGFSNIQNACICFVDSPSTTTATTYSVNVFCTRGSTDTIYVNQSITDSNSSNFARYASNITVMEISG